MGVLSGLALTSCRSMPHNATPVKGFEPKRYLGRWYEIARFDYRFEKDMNNVTAEYSQNPDGSIKVVNGGYDYRKHAWKTATGKVKFRGDEGTAALKVSFFGPFYAGYNVVDIDENYQHALVAGKNLDYLWMLSRTPELPDEVRQRFLEKAREIGYDTSRLVWVEHD